MPILRDSLRQRARRHLPKPTFCERCGATENLHRHHPDLEGQPLLIVGLCAHCHEEEHKANGTWGRGRPDIAACQICGALFQPKRSCRAKLCGNPECLKEMGRRAASRRWG